ncbi:MAG: nucleotidyltransferase [Oscillospiraceae bacterium]
MAQKALVILAAGIGSRYQGGIKQLDAVGPDGEAIMEYAIFDALRNGFDQIVLVIRREMKDVFRARLDGKFGKKAEVRYVYQELSDIPAGICVPADRVKPWGTGQAVLACAGVVKVPFAIIGADDYYGEAAIALAAKYLDAIVNTDVTGAFMPGFVLKNTISDNGAVTRGICRAANGFLQDLTETRGIRRDASAIVSDWNGVVTSLDPESLVSMNLWASTPALIDLLQAEFVRFFADFSEKTAQEQCTAEFILPEVISKLIHDGKLTVKVGRSDGEWFGMTHAADKELVREKLAELVAQGKYPAQLG